MDESVSFYPRKLFTKKITIRIINSPYSSILPISRYEGLDPALKRKVDESSRVENKILTPDKSFFFLSPQKEDGDKILKTLFADGDKILDVARAENFS